MNETHRNVRRGIRDPRDWPIKPVGSLPAESATPPRAPSGVGGLSSAQIARRTLEAQERSAQALEDIRDVVLAAVQGLAPAVHQIAETFGPAMMQATANLRELGDKILAAIERSALDTPDE